MAGYSTDYASTVHKKISSFYGKQHLSDCVFVVGEKKKEYPAIKALLAMIFNPHFKSGVRTDQHEKRMYTTNCNIYTKQM